MLIFIFQISVYKYFTSKQWLSFLVPEEQSKAIKRRDIASPAPYPEWNDASLKLKNGEWGRNALTKNMICPNIQKNGHFIPSPVYSCRLQYNGLIYAFIKQEILGSSLCLRVEKTRVREKSHLSLPCIHQESVQFGIASRNIFLLNMNLNTTVFENWYLRGMSLFMHTHVCSFYSIAANCSFYSIAANWITKNSYSFPSGMDVRKEPDWEFLNPLEMCLLDQDSQGSP